MKPDDGYICCITNPKSGASSRKAMGQKFQDYLVKKGFDVRVNLTESLEHACELATDAAVDYECALVVAIGGDGTVREVAHGLEGSDTPMIMVASGTENLLASELGFDERLSTLINTFEAGYTKRLDLGVVNGKCFTSIAGCGFDADVVKIVTENRKGNISYFDYFGPIWHTFWHHEFPTMDVEADGEQVFSGQAMVFVGNISRYGGGFHILKNADITDGLLDLCILECTSRTRLLRYVNRIAFKHHIGTKGVIYRQAKQIKVTSSEHVLTEIDGDPGPPLPIEIKVIPGAVNCLVPEGAKPAGLRTRIMRWLG